MAVENRGGFRPTAPQNNPNNINPMGGNGQSGMNTDYSGFAYGQNKAVNEQRKAAPITPTAAPTGQMGMARELVQEPLIPLDAPTQRPDEPITAGVDMGAGPGSEVLNLPQGVGLGQDVDSGIQAIRAMYMRDPRNQDLRRILELVDEPAGNL
jgi:hypothetical protein